MYRLCVIEGDGIGREVVPAAVEVLRALLPDLQLTRAEAGWDCFRATGSALPEATLEAMRACGAGLFGAVSSPAHKVEGYRSSILQLRQQLGLSVNLRPVRSWPRISPRQGIDLMILRENSEGLYSGRERMEAEGVAVAERVISVAASQRLARRASEVARLRQARRITLVHKANVLSLSCGLFRDTCRDLLMGDGWGDLLDERLVDLAALQLVERPEEFDLIVTSNLFGDILSDLACYWSGGLGVAPSLNWGEGIALAEPVHGSAPDIAGSGRANPLAAILSCALLLRFHWRETAMADRLEHAVERFLGKTPSLDFGIDTTLRIRDGVLRHL
jgi:homoisocitrate dehydrogenase